MFASTKMIPASGRTTTFPADGETTHRNVYLVLGSCSLYLLTNNNLQLTPCCLLLSFCSLHKKIFLGASKHLQTSLKPAVHGCLQFRYREYNLSDLDCSVETWVNRIAYSHFRMGGKLGPYSNVNSFFFLNEYISLTRAHTYTGSCLPLYLS